MIVNPSRLPLELSAFGLVWFGVLVGFLIAAVWQDLRARRIPNGVVVSGMVFGTCWHVLAPAGLGLFAALVGLMFGLVLLLPLYLMRVMGGGDVKLMAMVGVFLGPVDVLGAVLGTFLAGGVLAVVAVGRLWASRNHVLQPDGVNRQLAAKPPPGGGVQDPALRLPYALAIALGTMGYLGWRYFSLVAT